MSIKTLAVAVLLFVPCLASAQAADCASDADCPFGYVCMPVPCAMGCQAGEECPPCEETSQCVGDSEGEDEKGWISGECAADPDCPMFFKCEEVRIPCESAGCAPCGCPDCPDGEECPACECPPCDEPPPCEDETAMMCVYKPVACSADSDCEEGFECVEEEVCSGGSACSCGGCACSPCPEGEDCPPCDCEQEPECACDDQPPAEEQCEVFGAWCAPKEIDCGSGRACPDGWECAEFEEACACPDCACASQDCPEGEECRPADECECPPCDCADETAKLCVPGGWREAGIVTEEGTPAYAGEEGGKKDGDGNGEETGNPDNRGDAKGTSGSGSGSDSVTGCSTAGVTAGGTVAVFIFVASGGAWRSLRRRRR